MAESPGLTLSFFCPFPAVQEERQRGKDRNENEVESTSSANEDMPVEKILEAELAVEPKTETYIEANMGLTPSSVRHLCPLGPIPHTGLGEHSVGVTPAQQRAWVRAGLIWGRRAVQGSEMQMSSGERPRKAKPCAVQPAVPALLCPELQGVTCAVRRN